MKLFKKARKGFTLIELVVVIAVMAVLSAVAVVTYISITNKAKLSNDQLKVDQVNLSLTADETLNGKRKTVHETLQSLEDEGFRPENFTAESKGYQFVYVKELNKLALFKDGQLTYPKGVKANQKSDIYLFTGNGGNLKDGYSHYLTGENIEGEVQVNAGLDVGYNTKISSIDYDTRSLTEGQKVVVRSNSSETKITVNGPKDTLVHYGPAESVSVVDIASASYHENGEVKFFEASAGHIVLEKDAEVTAFHFVATNGEFKNADNKTISVDLSKVSEENMPAFSRDSVTIEENGTYVAEVKTDSTEYIWLFGNGIKEQMVATTSEGAIAENGTLKPGITSGAEDGSVAEQIANPAKRNDAGELVADDGVTPVTPEDAVVEELPTKADVQTGVTLFAGGKGTKNDPWMIVDYDTMQHVTTVSKTVARAKAVVAAASTSYNYNYYASFYGSYHAAFSGYDSYDEYFETEWLPYKKYADDPTLLPTSSYYFKVKDGVKTIDCNQNGKNWKYVVLYGNFDGNGVTFVNMDNNLFSNVSGAAGEKITIKNFTVRANICTELGDTIASKVLNDIDLIDITIHGYVQGSSNSALYLGYGPGDSTPWNCTFKNCYSDATYVSTISTGGVYVGHPYALPSNYSIKIIDCEYTGQMYTTSGGNNCHAYTNYWGSTYYVQVSNDSGVSFTSHQGGEALSTSQQNKTGIIGEIPEKYNVFITDAASNCDHATAFLTIGPNDNNEKGNYTNVYMTENNLRIENGKVYTDAIKYFDVTVNGNATDSTGLSSDGKVFNIVSGGYGTTYGSYFVVINQYDGNNNIISTTTFTLPLE